MLNWVYFMLAGINCMFIIFITRLHKKREFRNFSFQAMIVYRTHT